MNKPAIPFVVTCANVWYDCDRASDDFRLMRDDYRTFGMSVYHHNNDYLVLFDPNGTTTADDPYYSDDTAREIAYDLPTVEAVEEEIAVLAPYFDLPDPPDLPDEADTEAVEDYRYGVFALLQGVTIGEWYRAVKYHDKDMLPYDFVSHGYSQGDEAHIQCHGWQPSDMNALRRAVDRTLWDCPIGYNIEVCRTDTGERVIDETFDDQLRYEERLADICTYDKREVVDTLVSLAVEFETVRPDEADTLREALTTALPRHPSSY